MENKFINKTYYIDYEINMERGYGIESTSDTLCLEFDETGQLESATLYGIHFITELEFELDYDISQVEAKKLVANYLLDQGLSS